MGVITFNGRSSDEFGCTIEERPAHTRGSRRGELIEVPGRNGAMALEDGSYTTYTQSYVVAFEEGDATPPHRRAAQVAEWLLGSSGFCRLEDSFEPGFYRLARFSGPLNIGQVVNAYGRCTLEFECQPQRYLTSGETPISYEGDSSEVFVINNPTQFEASPLLKFVDTATTPEYIEQALTMREDIQIDPNGEVYESPDPSQLGLYATSSPVACSGKANAKVTGNGYAFLDSTGASRRGGFTRTGGGSFNQTVVVVPSWAASVVVSSEQGKAAALSLQEPRPDPGAAAVNINGTVVNLDFSNHDTIFLDCDLHDAYYADGSNANSAVSFSSKISYYPTFPKLSPGENTIIPGDGTILDFELTPRWWTL